MNFSFVCEIIGTVAFAVSGAQVAIEKKMDLFGVIILGMTTATGGGLIRDLILGITPPVVFREPVYALLAIAVSLLTFLPVIRRFLSRSRSWLRIMDSLGLGIFTVIGVKAGYTTQNVFLSIFLGVLTGVGGGVLRDLFAANQPSIFVRYFYASASLIGAAATVILLPYSEQWAQYIGICLVMVLRFLAVRYKWNLPRHN